MPVNIEVALTATVLQFSAYGLRRIALIPLKRDVNIGWAIFHIIIKRNRLVGVKIDSCRSG